MKGKNFAVTTLLWMIVIALVALPAAAQDFTKLLDAVDRVEANLKSMVEKEASMRAAEIAKLRSEFSGGVRSDSLTAQGPAFEQLKADLQALRTEVNQMKDASVNNPTQVSDSEWQQMQKEIVFLKQQVEKSTAQLASLDDEGGVSVAGKSSTPPPMKELAANLQEMVTQLRTVVADGKEAGKKMPANPTSTSYGKIALKGLLHEQYYNSEGNNKASYFDTKRVEIGLSGEINRWAKVDFTGDFAKSPRLLDAAITLMPIKYWSVIFGQYKPPFGAEFLRSSSMLPFIVRSKAAGLGPDRDVGAAIGFSQQWKDGTGLKITGGLFNGAPLNTSDANTDKNFMARAELKFANMFVVGPDVMTGKTNDVDSLKKNTDAVGASLNWNWKNESAEADYVHAKVGSTEKAGWYLWGGHSFKTKSIFLPEIQVLARFERFDPNLDKSNDATTRTTLGVNLFVDKKYTKIQVNYHFNGEEGKTVDNNELMLNLQVSF